MWVTLSWLRSCLIVSWQAEEIRHLEGQNLVCVAGAGHRTHFHPRGRGSTSRTLLKRWQAWAKNTIFCGKTWTMFPKPLGDCRHLDLIRGDHLAWQVKYVDASGSWWQVRCFRDLTSMKKWLKPGYPHFQFSLVVARAILSEILTYAHATLSLFCAGGINLVVGRCSL